MSLDRAQRRALTRDKKKQVVSDETIRSDAFDGTPSFWMVLLVALPAVVVPLYFVYMPVGSLIDGSYGQILINEFQKYVAELISFGFVFTGVGFYLFRHKTWPYIPRVILCPVLLYLCAVGLSIFHAIDLQSALLWGGQVYLLPVLLFLLVATLRCGFTHVALLFVSASVAATVVAVFGIAQVMKWPEFVLQLPSTRDWYGNPFPGSFLFSRNLAGEYLIVIIPSILAVIVAPLKRVVRVGAGGVALLLISHLVLTTARGSWVGLFFGGGFSVFISLFYVFSLRSDKKHILGSYFFSKKVAGILFCSFSVFLVLVFGSSNWIENRAKGVETPLKALSSINFKNASGRIEMWNDSFELLNSEWLSGVGPGHYRVESLTSIENTITSVDRHGNVNLITWDEQTGGFVYPLHPHNDYLENWLELGILGIVGLLWLFGVIVWVAGRGIGRALKEGDKSRTLIIFGTLSGFCAWAVSMFFEFPFRMPASMILGWMCAGLAVSFSLRDEEVKWQKIRPAYNWLAGGAIAVIVVACFYFAHIQFWGDIYEKQAMAAWNNKDHAQGYEWIQEAYGYTPWSASIGATKARMELGLRKYKEALETSREMVERHPYLLPVLWSQGTAARMLGRGEESREAFKTITEIYPFLPENEKYRRYAGLPPE